MDDLFIQRYRNIPPDVKRFFAEGDALHSNCPDYEPRTAEEIEGDCSFYFVVAIAGTERVGCGCLNMNTGEIERIFVAEHMRRRGIAKAILRELEAKAADLSELYRVFLDAKSNNAIAIRLYQDAGYSVDHCAGNFIFLEKRLRETPKMKMLIDNDWLRRTITSDPEVELDIGEPI